VGGNYGNFALSMIVFTPIIIYFLGDLRKNILIFTTLALLVSELPNLKASSNNYIETKKMQNQVLQSVKGKDLRILTDDESLFSSFLISDNNEIHSFGTMMVLEQHVNKQQNIEDFYLKRKDVELYDFLIINKINAKKIQLKDFQLIYTGKFNHIYSKI